MASPDEVAISLAEFVSRFDVLVQKSVSSGFVAMTTRGNRSMNKNRTSAEEIHVAFENLAQQMSDRITALRAWCDEHPDAMAELAAWHRQHVIERNRAAARKQMARRSLRVRYGCTNRLRIHRGI